MDTKDRLLRQRIVLDRVGFSKSKLWNDVKHGFFPQPIKLGPRTTAWKESDIDQYVENPGRWRSGEAA